MTNYRFNKNNILIVIQKKHNKLIIYNIIVICVKIKILEIQLLLNKIFIFKKQMMIIIISKRILMNKKNKYIVLKQKNLEMIKIKIKIKM